VSRLERKIERLKGRGAQRLQASEERYRRLVDNFPGAVVVFDRDFRYQLAGGGVLSARYDLDDIVGRTLWEAFGPELGARFEPYYREALTGTEVSFDILDDARTWCCRG